MLTKGKDINLLDPYYYKEPFSAKYGTTIKLMIPLVLIVALIGTGSMAIKLTSDKTKKQIGIAQEDLTALQLEIEKDTQRPIYDTYIQLDKANKDLQLIVDHLNSYPVLDQNTLFTLESACVGNKINSMIYDNGTGVISVYLESENVRAGESIVRVLKSLHMFESVSYNGYSGYEEFEAPVINIGDTDTETTTNAKIIYNLQISCKLKVGV